MQKLSALSVLFALVAGCSDDNITDPASYPYNLSADPAVAGADIQITSAAFASIANPTITADTATLTVTRVNDTTVSVLLPRTARGQYTLAVNGYSFAQINIAGFSGSTAAPTMFLGKAYPIVENGRASLILGTGDRRVVQFFPGTGTFRTLLENYLITNNLSRSAGPTRDPSVVILTPYDQNRVDPWNSTVKLWRLGAVPQQMGEISLVNARVIAAFNDSTVFRGFHHDLEVRHLRNGVWESGYRGVFEETTEVVMSPRGDRAALYVHQSFPGPPVFNTVTGDTAFFLRQLRGTKGVQFSASGDTLFALGYTAQNESILLAVDANTGAELLRLELGTWTDDMAFDKEFGVLYLMSTSPPPAAPFEGVLSAQVVDAKQFKVLGLMTATTSGYFGCAYKNSTVGPDGVFHLCHSTVWRFDRVQP